ncbi:1,5-anhydro-D-fructose reductase [Pteropus alecto]|uniref:1,5-anhydro-D-fructose reductase n=1 Tax=Pteropus alecto TaxID=9402 RepID=L5L1J6_PTEAL|nr:1,5-anhydro-D-fructose reductase [Pteropus alecto]
MPQDEGQFHRLAGSIECHPYLAQKNLISFCQSRGVSVTAYRPLGGSSEGVDLMDDPVIQSIARKHQKSPAQAGGAPAGRGNAARLAPGALDQVGRTLLAKLVFDFELTEQEMNDLLGLDRNLRLCAFDTTKNHKDYPFNTAF